MGRKKIRGGIPVENKYLEDIKLYEIAAEAGFSNASVIETDQMQFVPAFRALCEENDCGNYGKNYGCPPYCGSTDEMKKKVLNYRKAIVFQTQSPVMNVMDPAQTKPLKKMHIQKTRYAMKQMKEAGMDMDGFPIMCGPCNVCSTCALQEGQPCAFEEQRFSCLSAYCINATELASSCKMELEWSDKKASFLSLYVFDRK
jgi:predicted metal-binding protein